MVITPSVKKYWIKMQSKRAFPVNAMGIRIKPDNTDLLRKWRSEGIDQHMVRDHLRGRMR